MSFPGLITEALNECGLSSGGPTAQFWRRLGPGTPGPPGTSSYRRSFTTADLSPGGILLVTHNLGQDWVQITTFNNLRDVVIPDNARSLNPNQIALTFDRFNHPPIPGVWYLVVTA